MTDHAVFEITIKENGEVAFNKLASGAEKFEGRAKRAKVASTELSNSFSHLRETLLAGVGVFEALSFAKEGEALYLGVKRADAEIQASLRSTANAAGVTNKQLEESAEQLYHHSEYNIENIKRMQSVLLTFPKITKENFGEAETALTDMAAKLGGKDADLSGMAIRLGKALQDPATGMMMMRREGVNFTKVQQKMIEGMVASGHQMQAQKYILHELENEFGGSADAALQAGGAHEQMAKTTEELKIQVGEFVDMLETDLVPTISVIVGDIREWVKWGEKHKDGLETTAKVVAVLAAAVIAYNLAVKAAAAADFLFGTSLAELTIAEGEAAAATGGATEAVTAFDVAMDANPIGLVTAAVVGLGAAFMALSNSADEAANSYQNFYNNTAVDKKAFGSMSGDAQQKKYDEYIGKLVEAQRALKADQAIAANNPDQQVHSTGSWWIARKASDAVKEDQKAMADLQKEVIDMAGLLKPKGGPVSKSKGGALLGTSLGTPAPDSLKGEKQINNTWNIKEFGKSIIYPANVKEGATDIHDHLMSALTTAVNDSEIASGQ